MPSGVVAGAALSIKANLKDFYGAAYNGTAALDSTAEGTLERDLVKVAIHYSQPEFTQSSTASLRHQWSASLVAQISGTYTVSVHVRANASVGLVGGKTLSTTVSAAAIDATRCTMNVSGSPVVAAGVGFPVTVTARDRFHNPQTQDGSNKFELN